MIYYLSSDLKTFRGLEFSPGLNLLLADRSESATDRQTRNGAGKTSLVEVIHFLLGADARGDSIFRSEELAPWTFEMQLDLAGERVTIARSGLAPSRILVREGDTTAWKVSLRKDRESGEWTMPNTQWKAVLGEFMFGWANDAGEGAGRFAPSFRSLISYFARRQDSGGFASHLAQSSRQMPWDQHVAISYLLGLDWSISQRFQELREQEKTIRELRKSMREGTLPGFSGSAAVLRTQVTLADSRLRQLKGELDQFNVVPEYQAVEREASSLTRRMNGLGNQNTSDRELLDRLVAALRDENPPDDRDVVSLYEEAGIALGDSVVRRLEDAIEFHRTVVENRRAHLRSEVQRVETRIEDRDREKARLGERRAELMGILSSGGALEQYTALQEEYARLRAEAETLRMQLDIAERIESAQTRAEIERRELQERLRQDFHEHGEVLDDAIVLFEELSESLYERERAGNLTIDATDNGPTFEVHIDAQRSRGIINMQVFCFDMMLGILASRGSRSPGFLVHDSHLFDGVDERQVAKAIQIGADRAQGCGFQYLITMNSDALPQEGFERGFDLRRHLVPVRLDDTVEGSLFGMRFN